MKLKTLYGRSKEVDGQDLKGNRENIPVRGDLERPFDGRKLGKLQKLKEVFSRAEQIIECSITEVDR